MSHVITLKGIRSSIRTCLSIVRSALLAKGWRPRLKQSLVLLAALLTLLTQSTQYIPTARATTMQLDADWGRMPLYFIANQGQMDSRVAYYIQGSDKTLYFTPQGVTFAMNNPIPRLQNSPSRFREGLRERSERWIVKLDFVGANAVQPLGQKQTQAIISYFKGSSDDWHTGLPTYSRIVYSSLWEGVDLAYSGTVDKLKYEFVVQPGADPGRIRLAYRGAGLGVNQSGQLEVSTEAGGFQDDMPVAYQEVEGIRVPVTVHYALEGAATYGFSLGAYDSSLPLVIDPAVLIYCGFIGGSDNDYGKGIAVDTEGNAYVTGITDSTEASFPVTVGPDLTHNGGRDTFVCKVKADVTGLLYCGYIGGSGEDYGKGIALDTAGNAYVTGSTTSNEVNFPGTVGPDLTHNGVNDAFVAKVSDTIYIYLPLVLK